MDCRGFEAWLDQGLPEGAPAAEARAHADSCPACAAALAAAREVDLALSAAPAPAPAGFAARVMERVERARTARWLGWAEADFLPWWVRAAADPAAALAVGLAGLVLWQWDALIRLASAASAALAHPAVAALFRWLGGSLPLPDLSGLASPAVAAGLMLAMLPLGWLAGEAVYHWSGDPQSVPAARRRHGLAPR